MRGIFCKICQVFVKGNKKDFSSHERTVQHKKINKAVIL